MCQKLPTDNQDSKNMMFDIKKLKEAKARTVDKYELQSILNQARAKYTLAKIKHKQIVKQIEKQQEESQDDQQLSIEEAYRNHAKRQQRELMKQILSISDQQKKLLKKYQQMGDRLDKNMDEIVQTMKASDIDQKLDLIRQHQETLMKEREQYEKNLDQAEKLRLDVVAEQESFKAEKQLEDLQSNKNGMKLDAILNVSTLTGQISSQTSYSQQPPKAEQSSNGVQKYVIRKGRLVKGSAKKRVEAPYTNWHGGNADPEDLMQHRQLLDRQHFKGPVWDGVKPKSILDQNLDTIAMSQEESHPSQQNGLKEGKKQFQTIVR